MKNLSRILLLLSMTLLLIACTNPQTKKIETLEENKEAMTTEFVNPVEETAETTARLEAEFTIVHVVNNQGEEIGLAIFRETDEGITIDLNLEGIPMGEYGMHIHANRQATPPTFEDAGAHFNSTDVKHGIHSESGPHIGDLPNLIVPEEGVV